ncbi:MAG: oligosaccharide flippase family protein [Alkalinema sp. RU_4_3]|nr:oligosaccharide flippase family protein [Alkalinema sp. RU_4_3]
MNHSNSTNSKREWTYHTLWMMGSHGLKLVLQAVYFIVVARKLGAAEYGTFIAASAVAEVVSPFSTLGIGNLMVKNVARDRTLFSLYWGNALVTNLIAGTGLILGLMAIAPLFLPSSISPLLLGLAAVNSLIFSRILDLARMAYQSVSRFDRTAQMNLLPHMLRAGAALLMVSLFPDPNALDWMTMGLLCLGSASIASLVVIHREIGPAKPNLPKLYPELKQGSYFAVGLSAQSIYNDIDKTMLASLASVQATGLYAAAYRLIEVAFVPMRSLLDASYTRFFKAGKTGVQGTWLVARKLLPMMGGYGLVAALGLYFCAPVVPWVLGPEYQMAVPALQWLAPIVLLKGLHYIAADTLTGADLQGYRSLTQIGVALLNIVLNIGLIPRYGWQGAVIASLASDGLLMVLLWLFVALHYGRSTVALES